MEHGRSYRLGELASLLGLQIVVPDGFVHDGPASELLINGLATLQTAKAGQLSFLANSRYRTQLQTTKASAVIAKAEFAGQSAAVTLLTDDPYLAFARATQLFDTRPRPVAGIHPSTVIAENAHIDPSASIGPHCCVESDTSIGAGVTLGAGVFVGQGSRIENNSCLYANVTLYHGVSVGRDCVIHSGTVIGADGFGFAPNKGRWEKIAQLGGVQIGDGVEIGAGTTIDRGALDDTVIGNGVIIDNQVQIAHNVRIGEGTAIAGCTAIAGSTEIGSHCTIAGAVGIIGHLKIADRVHITAMTLVTKSINEAGSYSSGTGMQETANWRRNAVRFSQLDQLGQRMRQLEQEIDRKGAEAAEEE